MDDARETIKNLAAGTEVIIIVRAIPDFLLLHQKFDYIHIHALHYSIYESLPGCGIAAIVRDT